MLVLSRRPNERIVFPTLGISVKVNSVNRNVVRLGIEAPSSVPIAREEIISASATLSAAESKPARHVLRNRLHTANLAVHLAKKQLEAGLQNEADATLAEALQEFASIDQEMASEQITHARPKREVRALLVEDNRNESALLAEFLRLHGINVETAYDGQEALDYLRSHDRPDVILLDMRMPRCDGPRAVSEIRRDSSFDSMKVFAVSGADPKDWALGTSASGVDGWFTKPVDPAQLVQRMLQSLSLN